MLLVDNVGHLVSTVNENELHNFAEKLGLKRSMYKKKEYLHYNLSKVDIYEAIVQGAKRVDKKELVTKALKGKK